MGQNIAHLIGNLGDGISIKTFDDGNVVGQFSLATSESYTSKQTGEKITNTHWHTIVARNKTAEILEKYTKKGDQLSVTGAIRYRNYTDTNGVDRKICEIHLTEFTLLNNQK